MRFRAVPILVTALMATLTVACQGDEQQTVAKAEYVAKADAICRAANRTTQDIYDGVDSETDLNVLLPLIDRTADIQLQAVADIEALGTPDADAAEVANLMDDAKAMFKKFKDVKTTAEIDALQSKLDAMNRRVRSLGFKVCGQAA